MAFDGVAENGVPVTALLKRCIHCNVDHALDLYHKDKSRVDGLYSICKICRAIYNVEHKEDQKKRNSKFYAAHADEEKRKKALIRASKPKKPAKPVSQDVIDRRTARLVRIEKRQTLLLLRSKGLKACSRCHVVKEFAKFPQRKSASDGCSSACNQCYSELRLLNVESPLGRRRVEKTLLRESGRKRCSTCKEIKPFSMFSAASSCFDGYARSCKFCIKSWKLSNKPRIRCQERNRRARSYSAQGRHSVDDIELLMKLQNGKCAHPWCRVSIKKIHHKDHIIPLVSGGSNDRKNIQLLCVKCNLKKHAKHPIVFAQLNGYLL